MTLFYWTAVVLFGTIALTFVIFMAEDDGASRNHRQGAAGIVIVFALLAAWGTVAALLARIPGAAQ